MDTIFFPRNDYPNNIEVCAHRLGKKMTYSDSTDALQIHLSYLPYMAMAKARNIKVDCFLRLDEPVVDTPNGDVISDYLNNKIWLDAYSYAPNIAAKIPQTGAAGQITEEEWNEAYNDYILPNFYAFTGKKPVALSYSYGNASFADYTEMFIAARNSPYNGHTDYGVGYGNPANQPYNFNVFKLRSSTTRWYDYAKEVLGNDFQASLDLLSAKIDETILNNGWVNNFTHWHNYWQDGNEEWAEAYLDLLAQKNLNNEIYFAGYGEAVAYLVYRQLITKVVMYSPRHESTKKLVIRLEAQNNLGIDTDLLQVPISIKFSTVGTPLAGKEITSENHLISLGGGDYIVEIPYTGRFPYAIIDGI